MPESDTQMEPQNISVKCKRSSGIGIEQFSYSDARNHALGANQASGLAHSLIPDAHNPTWGVNQASGLADYPFPDATKPFSPFFKTVPQKNGFPQDLFHKIFSPIFPLVTTLPMC